jgi:diguanylate cyclase (GGDEF)-like protein/PAS domain S-box-containing protein
LHTITKLTESTAQLGDQIARYVPFFRSSEHSLLKQVLLAVVLLWLALTLRLLMAPLQAGLQYLTFFPAITLAGVIGGYRAGLLSTALAMLLTTFILTPPYFSISLENIQNSLWPNLVFLVNGIFISFAFDGWHLYRLRFQNELEQARKAQEQTQALNQELTKSIQELKRADAELRIAATTFESLDAIMVTDAAARIVRVNQSFVDTTGYSMEEVLGKNPSILKSDRHDENFYTAMWQSIHETGHWHGEIWDRHKSGYIYPKETTITAVKDASGTPQHYVAIFRNITERKQTEKQMHGLAFYDALTELPNRRLLLDRLTTAIDASTRYQQYAALMFLDLDRFKALNDTLGHNYGDMLLVQVAQRLKHCVRKIDTVARLGGDEFVILIENMSENQDSAFQQALLGADKIRTTLRTPYRLQDRFVQSAPSIGFYLFCGNTESVDDILKHADVAMYQSKRDGHGTVHFAIQPQAPSQL